MGTTFIHAMSMAVFMVLKSLDRSHIQLCQQSLARLLQGKNFDNENQNQRQNQMIMRIIFNTTLARTKTLRRVSYVCMRIMRSLSKKKRFNVGGTS